MSNETSKKLQHPSRMRPPLAEGISTLLTEASTTGRSLLLAAFVSASACGNGDAPGGHELGSTPNPTVRKSSTASLGALIRASPTIGFEFQPSSKAEAFARVVDAQLSPDGRLIAVLDMVPPYVRIFDLEGVLQAAFVPNGEGPGEATQPAALAVSHERILLAEPGRVSWFDLTGSLLADRSDLRFWPQSAARGCDDDFVLYGAGPDPAGDIVSLRSVRLNDDTPNAIIRDTGRPQLFTRLARPLGSGGDLLVVHHDSRSPPETMTLTCPDYQLVRVDTFPELERASRDDGRSGSSRSVQLINGQSIFGGIAVIDGHPFMSVAIVSERFTRFIRVRADTTFSYDTEPSVRLLDANPNSVVLLTRSDPVPHLILVDYNHFLKALER